MRRNTVLTGLLVVVLVAGGAALVRRKMAQVAAAPTPTLRPMMVRTAEAKAGVLRDTRTYLARVESWQVAEVSAQITGRIRTIEVREGDRVRRGQTVVVIDDAEMQSALSSAEAQVAQARALAAAQAATVGTLETSVRYWEKEWRRDDSLAREGAIAEAAADATSDRLNEARGRLSAGKQALEAANRQIEAQEKRREEIEAKRDYTRVRSPFDGLVARRLADPGDLAVPGKALLVVEDRSRSKLVFEVPQQDLSRVTQGVPVRVRGELDLDLTVSRLYPSLNPDRTRTVEASVSGSVPLPSGSYYPVELTLDTLENSILVPEECVVEAGDGSSAVFGVVSGRLQTFPVVVKLVRNGMAGVDGIDAGLAVVRSTYLGWNRLSSGEAVEVLP